MKGKLTKENEQWFITYLDWTYKSNETSATLGGYRKQLKEFKVQLYPHDANDADSLCNTTYTLDGKEVRFAFKEVGGKRYATLKNPKEVYPPDEVEQEMLMDSLDNCIKDVKYATATDIKFSTNIGHKCLICESHMDWSTPDPMCGLCLEALKSIILEKRAMPK